MNFIKKAKSLRSKTIKTYLSSEILKSSTKLISSAVLSQLISILFSPILSRIYLPSDYGALGVYMSILGIITTFSTLQFSNAIIIAKSPEEVLGLIKTSIKILITLFFLILFTLPTFKNILLIKFNSTELNFWIWVLPFSFLLNGINAVAAPIATKEGLFSIVAKNRIYMAFSTTAISLSLGLIFKNSIGLFAGFFVGQFINSITLFILINKKTEKKYSFHSILIADDKKIWSTYKSFPIYNLPSTLINTLSSQIPLFMVNAYGGLTEVGNFNMCNRLLGIPSIFISNSIGEVFKQKATKDFLKNGNCENAFNKTFKILLASSIIPYCTLILFGPYLFQIILGPKWTLAGEYAQILGLIFFLGFVISPLTYMFFIANKQKENLFLQLLILFTVYLSFYLGYQKFHTLSACLLIYSLTYSATYLIYFIISKKLSKGIA